MGKVAEKCFFCEQPTNSEGKCRRITARNFHQLKVSDVQFERAVGTRICLQCWISKTVHPLGKKCWAGCCNSTKKQLHRLYNVPMITANADVRQEVLRQFKISEDAKMCGRFRQKILGFAKEIEQRRQTAPKLTPPESLTTATTTCVTLGRPRVKYTNASGATKRRMLSSAKHLVSEVVEKCNTISKGNGLELFEDITNSGHLRRRTKSTQDEENKVNEVIAGISKTYHKEEHGSPGKIRLLSTLAPHFRNKELKSAIPCTDYELTEARKHAVLYGEGATPPTLKGIKRFRIPPEDLAFVLNFVHSPDNTCRSPHRMASCEGAKSSWISDLFDQKQQPVMWLKDGRSHLYQKYRTECENAGRKPISESKFREGLNAGNFKEMVKMAGLCNICDEVGAQNWKKFSELIENLEKDCLQSFREKIKCEEINELEEEFKRTDRVTMEDLTNEDYTYTPCNPLPVDSPVLMIEVNASTTNFTNFSTRAKILKGHLLSSFTTELKAHSTCAFHCMEWLLNDNATCNNHAALCPECIERFTLFDDLNASVYVSNLHTNQKKYYQDQFKQIQQKLDLYVAHLVRGKYQRMQFMNEIDRLETGEAVVVCDYMMKLLLEKFREPQRDWFGKKGVSVHGSMFFFKSEESSDIQVEIHDVFSNGDCTQNWFFSASALEASFGNFSKRHKDITSIVMWSDNGPHYHNTSFILWLSRVSELCTMNLERYSFFEAQKGKTSLDSHFATFKFSLKGWMKKGNDLLGSADIINGTKDHLKGAHVYEIHIDRTKEPKSAKTFDGITSFADFTYINYPAERFAAIHARELTNLGTISKLKPKKINGLWPTYITSDSVSTGVTTEIDQDISESVQPKFKAQNTTSKNAALPEPETSFTDTTDCEKENMCPKSKGE